MGRRMRRWPAPKNNSYVWGSPTGRLLPGGQVHLPGRTPRISEKRSRARAPLPGQHHDRGWPRPPRGGLQDRSRAAARDRSPYKGLLSRLPSAGVWELEWATVPSTDKKCSLNEQHVPLRRDCAKHVVHTEHQLSFPEAGPVGSADRVLTGEAPPPIKSLGLESVEIPQWTTRPTRCHNRRRERRSVHPACGRPERPPGSSAPSFLWTPVHAAFPVDFAPHPITVRHRNCE